MAEDRDITAFARMRDEARAGFLPHRIVRSVRLHHRQVYRYCVHQGKVRAILTGPEHRAYAGVGQYLYEMLSSCPHSLRSEEHTSELQSLMRISYAVFCLQKKTNR